MSQKISKKAKELSVHINNELVLEFIIRAQENGKELYKAAVSLFKKKQYGIARSLAISAREEFGKSHIGFEYLFGKIEKAEFAHIVRSHPSKQLYGALSIRIAMLLKMLSANLLSESNFSENPKETIEVFFKSLNENFDKIEKQIEQDWPKLESELLGARDGKDEQTRQSGLYVSLDLVMNEIKLRTPSAITRNEAEEEIQKLEEFINMVNDPENSNEKTSSEISKSDIHIMTEIFNQIDDFSLFDKTQKETGK